MLKECLTSILQQTFTDFEVIVGNDYTGEILTAEQFGIKDPRVKFVNYPRNLGPNRSMNTLLDMGQGKYFTWLADDDQYAPDFLHAVHAALVKFDFPSCVFTSFKSGTTFHNEMEIHARQEHLFEGSRFVQLYLARKLKAIGSYGAFDKEYIRQIGGIKRLGNGFFFSPYSDNLLVIRTGLLEKLVYIDAPLVFFRTHEQSMSLVSTDVDAYSSAQADLLSESIEVFRSEGLRADFHSNLFHLLRWCIRDFAAVVHRSGFITREQVITYLLFMKKYIIFLKGSPLYWRALGLLMKTTFELICSIGKMKLSRRFRKHSSELLDREDNNSAQD